jgi:hypothetical protein
MMTGQRQTYLLFVVPISHRQETLSKKDLEFPDEEIP